MDYIVIFVSTGSAEEGSKIAKMLVNDSLAACVNLIPAVRSFYLWDDMLQDEQETLLIIKTVATNYSKIESAILKEHSYETPEIIAIKVAGGSQNYLDWIVSATKKENYNK
ncbi:MAG: divalent-cation tolerance protein CutA [Nitrospinota bacterium]